MLPVKWTQPLPSMNSLHAGINNNNNTTSVLCSAFFFCIFDQNLIDSSDKDHLFPQLCLWILCLISRARYSNNQDHCRLF